MSFKLECHSNWNVTQIGMSLTYECHSNWNVTQIRMALKFECHTKGWGHKINDGVVAAKTHTAP